jgi:20S proteasome subunit beta 5
MLSDLVGLDEILEDISFERKLGEPLKPFEQLMGCMPPSQAHILPEPYRWLMTNPESPIFDFYPKTFTIDMNGKRWPWEAVALLPFIDSKRLLDAASKIDESQLTKQERERNSFGKTIVLEYDPEQSDSVAGIAASEGFQSIGQNKAKIMIYESSGWNKNLPESPVLRPELLPGIQVPLPGFGSLRDAPVHSLVKKKLGLNVHGTRSRYQTSCLEMSNIASSVPPLEMVAEQLIGKTVFINYPYFLEAFVTAVSNEHGTIQGQNEPTQWSQAEMYGWQARRLGMERRLERGEGYTGTGGLVIPDDQRMTLSVRPFEGIVETEDGNIAKRYAKFTIEVPYISTLWNPSNPDHRFSTAPPLLEPNVYDIATPLHEAASDRTGSGRRTLFPPRSQPSSGNSSHATVQTKSTNGSEHSKHMSRKTAGPLFPPRNKQSSSSNVVDPQTPGITGAVGVVRKTLLPPKRASISKSGFSTFAQGVQQNPCETPFSGVRSMNKASHELLCKRNGPNMAATVRSKSGPRGRMLAAGVVVAGFLFHAADGSAASSSHCTIGDLPSLSRGSLIDVKRPSVDFIHDVRGGDMELDDMLDTSSSSVPPLEFAHGTTTISFLFQGGIIAAVDSRASLGSFVGSKTTQKVLPINSHILGTMAGGAADCMYWIRKLKSQALLHELTESTRMTVARASRLLSNALYQNRGLGLSVGTMVMGFDEDGTPKIYYVDNTGVRIEGDQFAVGSGGTFALGILDTERRHNLSEEDAISLGIKAIRHATFRDAYSGGFINVFLITKDGWKKVFTEDLARSTGNAANR